MQGQPAVDTEARARSSAPAASDAVAASGRPPLLDDLEQRIHELESLDDERFGPFTRVDWILCTVGSFALPYLCYLWFWP